MPHESHTTFHNERFATRSLNEAAHLIAFGITPIEVMCHSPGAILIFPAEARAAVERFNDARNQAAAMLSQGALIGQRLAQQREAT